MPCLPISVRFHDGRYHGAGDWPPSPARLFQALVAGVARGASVQDEEVAALEWLESLAPPIIAAPPAYLGQGFKTFVPNNDLDALGGDPARIGEIRAAKTIRPRTFDAATALLYAWTFAGSADAERHARTICDIAGKLYQLGRGVDMAWAQGAVLDENMPDEELGERGRTVWRPAETGGGAMLACPHSGSFGSLAKRYAAMRERFKTIGKGRKSSRLFVQPPKPSFTHIPYNSPSTFILFDIKKADAFAARRLERVAALTETIRDGAAARLKSGLPDDAALIDRVFIGRDAAEADKAQRIRITPLPTVGHSYADRLIRRVLVTVPPDCPIATGNIEWAFSGLGLDVDPETGEVPEDGAILVDAADRAMLPHYGIGNAAPGRLWRTVTPAALSEPAARRRIDPRRMREEAKDGSERLREHAAAEKAVRQALRHAGIDTPAQAIRVQREPFQAKGQRAEASANPRFAKERLWHVEIAFARPVSGPLLIGDGRYLGLGLMERVRRTEGVFAFAVVDGLTPQADPQSLARALRRAVIARVQSRLGVGKELPVFFSGHADDGAPARSGSHQHLAFAFDAPRQRLMIVAPHLLERRGVSQDERRNLRALADALEDFQELRAGAAGKVCLVPCHVDRQADPLFAPSATWESLTSYRVTRHAKLGDAAAAVEADLLAECRRGHLPTPQIDVAETSAKSGMGLCGRVKLTFRAAVVGPVLLGRDRHFGGGLFAAAK